ncbi:MAG: hypothetical protein AVDCRST_MAG90-1519, partial [uncultured Microvirga sp.]
VRDERLVAGRPSRRSRDRACSRDRAQEHARPHAPGLWRPSASAASGTHQL